MLVFLVRKIWEFFDKEIQIPNNPNELKFYEELDVKAKLIIPLQ